MSPDFFLFKDLQLPNRTLKVEINNIGHVGKVGLKRRCFEGTWTHQIKFMKDQKSKNKNSVASGRAFCISFWDGIGRAP